MSKTVPARELRAHLAELLDEVADSRRANLKRVVQPHIHGTIVSVRLQVVAEGLADEWIGFSLFSVNS